MELWVIRRARREPRRGITGCKYHGRQVGKGGGRVPRIGPAPESAATLEGEAEHFRIRHVADEFRQIRAELGRVRGRSPNGPGGDGRRLLAWS